MSTMTLEDPSLHHVSDGRNGRLVTTRAGITIGILHQGKPKPVSRDAETIQAALLDPACRRPLSIRARMWRCIVRWL